MRKRRLQEFEGMTVVEMVVIHVLLAPVVLAARTKELLWGKRRDKR